jgi:hypothetical protein
MAGDPQYSVICDPAATDSLIAAMYDIAPVQVARHDSRPTREPAPAAKHWLVEAPRYSASAAAAERPPVLDRPPRPEPATDDAGADARASQAPAWVALRAAEYPHCAELSALQHPVRRRVEQAACQLETFRFGTRSGNVAAASFLLLVGLAPPLLAMGARDGAAIWGWSLLWGLPWGLGGLGMLWNPYVIRISPSSVVTVESVMETKDVHCGDIQHVVQRQDQNGNLLGFDLVHPRGTLSLKRDCSAVVDRIVARRPALRLETRVIEVSDD